MWRPRRDLRKSEKHFLRFFPSEERGHALRAVQWRCLSQAGGRILQRLPSRGRFDRRIFGVLRRVQCVERGRRAARCGGGGRCCKRRHASEPTSKHRACGRRRRAAALRAARRGAKWQPPQGHRALRAARLPAHHRPAAESGAEQGGHCGLGAGNPAVHTWDADATYSDWARKYEAAYTVAPLQRRRAVLQASPRLRARQQTLFNRAPPCAATGAKRKAADHRCIECGNASVDAAGANLC